MAATKDPLHDDTHIRRILSDLATFLKDEPDEAPRVDPNILLPAICWHDTWKATRFPTTIATMFFDQYWDGYGSLIAFTRYARRHGIPSRYRRAIGYAIREHGQLRLFGRIRTREAILLRDLDSLEQWNLVRLEPMKEKYLNPDNLNPRLMRVARFYFDRFMAKTTDKALHYPWSKAEFAKRKTVYLEEVDRLMREYGHLL